MEPADIIEEAEESLRREAQRVQQEIEEAAARERERALRQEQLDAFDTSFEKGELDQYEEENPDKPI